MNLCQGMEGDTKIQTIVYRNCYPFAKPRDLLGEVGGSPRVPTGGSVLWEGLGEGS